jgi:hypothetical protein
MSTLSEARKERMSALMRLSRQRGIASGATGKQLLHGERFLTEEKMQEFREIVRQLKTDFSAFE